MNDIVRTATKHNYLSMKTHYVHKAAFTVSTIEQTYVESKCENEIKHRINQIMTKLGFSFPSVY